MYNLTILIDSFYTLLANVFLGLGTLRSCVGSFPMKEGGVQVLAGLAPLSLIVGSLLRTPGPWLAKPAGKLPTHIPILSTGTYLSEAPISCSTIG